MSSNIASFLMTTVMAFSLQACLPAAEAASVNGVTIPDSQVTKTLQQAHLPDTPQARNAITQQLIARELFRQEAARDKSLESRPDVRQAIRDARSAILTQAWLKDHIRPAPVTDADIRARYDAIVASLGDKEYKARILQVADEAAARAALARIRGGEDFARVAQEVSLAPSKAAGGAMDWISFKVPAQEGQTQGLPLALAQAIAALPAGAVSAAPIAVDNRFFLLKVDEVRATQVPSFDDAKPGIRQALQARALQRATTELVTELLAKARIVQ